MIFEFQPENVTKELLLREHSEEAYFAHYLGINPDKGLFRSPLRADDNPTCSFYRNKAGDLIFKDFGDGFHGNFINVVMHIFKVPYYKALSVIANDFNIVKKAHYAINEAKIIYNGAKVDQKLETVIQVELKEYTEKELEWWLKFGITAKTLKKFKVFSLKTVFLNGAYFCSSTEANPIYGYYFGTKDGRELWKIYFPMKRKYRFLLNTDSIQGAKQLPKGSREVVVITKSLKDVMSLYELGIPAIAPQSETAPVKVKLVTGLEKLGFKFVFVNGDWDRAGQSFMINSRKTFSCICLSFRNKSKYGKDISDFIARYGMEKAKSLVNKIREVFKAGKFDYQLSRVKTSK
jgi:hypothetical protein